MFLLDISASLLKLGVERHNKRVRLILLDGTTESVCRIEAPGVLIPFLQSDDAAIFRGRPQLKTKKEQVQIYVRDVLAGQIPTQDLLIAIQQVASPVTS